MRSWMLALVLGLGLAACSGPKAVETGDPGPTVDGPKETKPTPPERKDPFLDKVDRFEAAYGELACKANPDVDESSGLTTLRDPYERLQEIAEGGSLTLEVYLRILKKHGFQTADEFYKAKDYIELAKPGWFNGLKGRLFEFVEMCHK